MSGVLPERAISVHVAQTDAEREACYALRYRVFIEELKGEAPTADHHRRIYRVAEDDSATQLYARCGDDLIGTMRLHHGATSELPLDFREGCDLDRFLPDTPIGQMMTIGHLAIEKGQRGGPAIVALFQGCFRLVMENHPDTRLVFIIARDDPKLIALYRMVGFRPVDPNKRVQLDVGPCLPMFVKIAAAIAV